MQKGFYYFCVTMKLIKTILNTIPRPWLIRFSYIFMWFTRILYRGNKHACPVCNKKYRKFLPYGYGKVRENALCPGCFSLERHRLMWLYLQNKTSFFKDNLKVLHIAPEQCFLKRFKSLKNLTYHTADLESPIADYKCDVQNMPFEDNLYDVVICNHVLEHIPDHKKAMKEILRVISPGGYAILQVPADLTRDVTFEDDSITDPKERARIFGQYDHLRVYGKDYPDILRSVGFVIDEDNYYDVLTKETKDKYNLNLRDFMFACKKPL